jgi:hypothetical protein
MNHHPQRPSVEQLDRGLEHGLVVVEPKAVPSPHEELHRAQLISYLKAAGLSLGLLLNFGGLPRPALCPGMGSQRNGSVITRPGASPSHSVQYAAVPSTANQKRLRSAVVASTTGSPPVFGMR